MSSRLRGLAVAGYAGVSMVFLFVVQLPVMLLTRSGDFSIWLARRVWAPSALWLAGVRVEAHALADLPAGPAIYVANHESALDVWVLFHAIRRNLRFIAKRELFRIPIFGWYLSLARFVEVDRRNRVRAVLALKKAGEMVRAGVSLIAFPEGTRSPDGRVQPFKKGPFVLAMEAGVPVVPVAIAGAATLNPKRRLEVRPGTIHLALGEPVNPRDFADKDALLREVRRRIIQQHRSLGGLGGLGSDEDTEPVREPPGSIREQLVGPALRG
jgi:1-acyl-sn-glycerol-3-phosphate acyltransferase